MPIFEYNNTKIDVPEDKIEAFKKNFPTAILFEAKEKEIEITPEIQSPSVEKPAELIPEQTSVAPKAPREELSMRPLQTDTSDYVGAKMGADLKGAFDKTSLGEERLDELAEASKSPDYSKSVTDQAYDSLTGYSDRPIQKLGQKEDGIGKAAREGYEPYKAEVQDGRIFKASLIPQIENLKKEISTKFKMINIQEKYKCQLGVHKPQLHVSPAIGQDGDAQDQGQYRRRPGNA